MLYELDLHGLAVAEAILKCDRFLSEANRYGLYHVSIVHGKGTGALRDAIQGHLSQHPMIRSFRSGRRDEGGDGVTIAELRTNKNARLSRDKTLH